MYNQAGAGPKNISLNLISELKQSSHSDDSFFVIVPDFAEYKMLESNDVVTIIKVPRFNNVFKTVAFRIYLDFILIPNLVCVNKIQSFLAFGNYLLSPVKLKKTVLLHHPYIFDDQLLNKLSFIPRSVELLKRFVFRITLKNVDTVVVQSLFVFEQFKKKYGSFNGRIEIISNPISRNFLIQTQSNIDELISSRAEKFDEELIMLYVSRFYPHKNHDFLIQLSQRLESAGVRHKILITIDESLPKASDYLERAVFQKTSIFNLGEISQQALEHYYLKSHIFVFPSVSETFGNPLIEAMNFGLPVIVPDLGYARSILAEAGIYYNVNDVNDCVKQVECIISDNAYYRKKSHESYNQLDFYTAAKVWADKYIELMS